MVNIAGKDSVSIGSDFGCILSGFPDGLFSVDNLQSFLKILPKNLREKIAYKNALSALKKQLK